MADSTQNSTADAGKNTPFVKTLCKCGASISEPQGKGNSWIADEIMAQINGVTKYKADLTAAYDKFQKEPHFHGEDVLPLLLPGVDPFPAAKKYLEAREAQIRFEKDYFKAEPWNIKHYARWANGNQGYKWGNLVGFSAKTGCGKNCGCGQSVTLCGKCVRSWALGNIMYGFIGNYIGFGINELTDCIDDYKKPERLYNTYLKGQDDDEKEVHHQQYALGFFLFENLRDSSVLTAEGLTKSFCAPFTALLATSPKALHDPTPKHPKAVDPKKSDVVNFDKCLPCAETTQTLWHGGGRKEFESDSQPPTNDNR